MQTDATLETLRTSLCSERKWRNVQSVLVESLRGVARVLETQEQLIQTLQGRVGDLERLGSNAATAEQVTTTGVDAERRALRLEKKMGEKVESGARRAEAAVAKLEQRWMKRCNEIEESLRQLAGRMEAQDERVEGQRLKLKRQMTLVQEHTAQEERLRNMYQDVAKKADTLERKVTDLEEKRETAVVPVGKEVMVATPEPQEREMDAIHGTLAQVSKEIVELETKLERKLASWRQELAATIGKKLCKSEATKLFSRKMDTMDAWKQLAEKADCARVEEVAGTLMDSIQRYQESTIDELQRLRKLSEGKVDAIELAQVKHNMHNVVAVAESIQHELTALKRATNEKMSVMDAKELLGSQATLGVLYEARKQIESATPGEFAGKSQLDTIAQQVQAITRQLRSEIYQARYIWKDGRPSVKQTIQWSAQVVNTNADVFLWQFGSDEVRLLLPGLYHLQAAFFTNYSPTIQVLVNGEPGFISRSRSDPRASSSQPVLERLHHSAGNVVGFGIDVFLALPARALVAISYDLDEKAQGFLNLRKL